MKLGEIEDNLLGEIENNLSDLSQDPSSGNAVFTSARLEKPASHKYFMAEGIEYPEGSLR